MRQSNSPATEMQLSSGHVLQLRLTGSQVHPRSVIPCWHLGTPTTTVPRLPLRTNKLEQKLVRGESGLGAELSHMSQWPLLAALTPALSPITVLYRCKKQGANPQWHHPGSILPGHLFPTLPLTSELLHAAGAQPISVPTPVHQGHEGSEDARATLSTPHCPMLELT